jgi:hypothetical protein
MAVGGRGRGRDIGSADVVGPVEAQRSGASPPEHDAAAVREGQRGHKIILEQAVARDADAQGRKAVFVVVVFAVVELGVVVGRRNWVARG